VTAGQPRSVTVRRTLERHPMAVFNSVLEMIGNTPMIDVSQLSPNPEVRILA
jgi:hypothetical protein